MAEDERPIPTASEGIRALLGDDTASGVINRGYKYNKKDPKTGRIIITYSLEEAQTRIGVSSNEYEDIKPVAPTLGDQKRKEITDALAIIMRNISDNENVVFRYVSTLEERKKADIRFFVGKRKEAHGGKKNLGGTASHSELGHEILIYADNEKEFVYGTRGAATLEHEIRHALHFGHPGGEGKNPLYNDDLTALSYLSGQIRVKGSRALDVMASHAQFGKPKDASETRTMNLSRLLTSTTLWTPREMDLDFTDAKAESGHIDINMSPAAYHDVVVKGGVMVGGATKELGIQLVPDGTIQRVKGTGANIRFKVVGRSCAVIEGGKMDDRLIAKGGHNELTGGGGRDCFEFTAESGYGNVVKDYNRRAGDKDWIMLDDSLTRVEIYQMGSNTQMSLFTKKDGAEKCVGSALVLNATPAEIRSGLIHYSVRTQVMDVAPPPPATPENSHYSGLLVPGVSPAPPRQAGKEPKPH